MTTGVFPLEDNQAEAKHAYSDDEDALNEVEVNGNWTPQEKALHEARLKAKAKRRLRRSSSRNSASESLSESGELAGSDPNSPKGKVNTNDRKSRTGKGRGLPKKGVKLSVVEFNPLNIESGQWLSFLKTMPFLTTSRN